MATPLADSSPPRSAELADEGNLVRALCAREHGAFGALVQRHYATMKRVARSYVHSEALVEEVVQETWLAVIGGIERFEARSALDTWIYAILVNRARTLGARERRTLPFSSLDDRDEDDSSVDADRFQRDDDQWPGHWATPPRPWQKPERRLLSLELRERLRDALDELPERQREVLALRDVEGLGSEDVCALLGLSAENQRVLLHRGRSRLRTKLEAYVDGP
jgi:RNA polymerase sigma-70 factor (ECF subfamily)